MASNRKRILVTGAAGLIGRELCQQLGNLGHDVVGVDNNQRFPNYVPACAYIQDDITYYIQRTPNDFDYIYHMAAINGTTSFYEHPTDVLFNNTTTDLAVFKFASLNPKTKLIYAGSSEVVSGTDQYPTPEVTDVVINNIHNPRWSYRLPKILAENYLVNSNLNYLIVRFFNVFSEHAGPGHFLRDVVEKIKYRKFELWGADETRTFCYVSDAVDALLNIVDMVNNDVINIGGYEELLILDAANIIASAMGYINPAWVITSGKEGSTARRCPDITKLREYYPEFAPIRFANAISNIRNLL